MKIDLQRFILVVLALVLPHAVGGCAAVAVGGVAAGSVAFAKGDLESNLDANLTRSVAAVDSAIYYLRLLKIDQRQVRPPGGKEEVTRITIRDPDDYRIVIRLVPVSYEVTHISIRVGTFGNEARSQAILDEIRRSLVW